MAKLDHTEKKDKISYVLFADEDEILVILGGKAEHYHDIKNKTKNWTKEKLVTYSKDQEGDKGER